MKTNNLKTKSVKKSPTNRKSENEMIVYLIEDVNYLTARLREYDDIATNLTPKERLRLFSAGVRNNGFIDKAFDIANDNQNFLPPNFDVNSLRDNEQRFEVLRQLMLACQQLLQLATNSFMLQSDMCYREALRIYGSLREQTRGRVPGAEPLYQALRTFFRKRRRVSNEPTEMQLERDVKKLIKGKADGEIIIRNESPTTTGGIHKIIDNVNTSKSAVKESASIVVDNSTDTKKIA